MSNTPKLRFPEFSGEWEEKKFYEVFDILQNNTFSRDQLNNENGIVRNIHYGDVLIKYGDYIDCQKEELPFINLENNLSKYEDTSYVKNGDIIIADTAEDYTAGKVTEICNVKDYKILSGLHTFLCRPKFEFASKFLGYKLNSGSYHNQIAPLVAGTKVYSINRKAIGETTITYPSKAEQQIIADFLSNVDSIITAETKILNALQKKKKALLQKLFTQQLRFKSDDGTDFPTWEKKKLGDVCEEFKAGKTITSHDISEKGEYPVYGGNGLRGYYNEFNHDGYYVLIGRQGALCGNINEVQGKTYISEHAIAIKANDDNLSKYLFFFLDYCNLNQYSESSAQPGLSVQKLIIKQFSFPCRAEQQKIADCLSSIDSLIQTQQKVVTTWYQRKKALLQRMFI